MKVVTKSLKIIAYVWIGFLSISVSAHATTIDKYITDARATLPKKVDQITTWTAIKRSGDQIIYTKEIDLSFFKPEVQKLLLDNLDKLEAQVKRGLTERSCKDKAVRYAMDANYAMTHSIYTTDDKHLFDVNINRSMCNY